MKAHLIKEQEKTGNAESAVLKTEERFFAALARRDREALERLVADDCILIDVLTGSEVPRVVFIDLIGSERLVFESIEPLDARVRLYGVTAVVTGETRMIGRFDTKTFAVHSRYTHVYAHMKDGFRLINAQGTPVAATAA
jgi:ketosteroid isomerase-like protein